MAKELKFAVIGKKIEYGFVKRGKKIIGVFYVRAMRAGTIVDVIVQSMKVSEFAKRGWLKEATDTLIDEYKATIINFCGVITRGRIGGFIEEVEI